MKKVNGIFIFVLGAAAILIYLFVAKNFGYYPFEYSTSKVYGDNGLLQKEMFVKNGVYVGVAKEYTNVGELKTEYNLNGSYRKHYVRNSHGVTEHS